MKEGYLNLCSGQSEHSCTSVPMINFLQIDDAAPANRFIIVYTHPAADRDLKLTAGGHAKIL